MAELASLGLLVAQAERKREATGEGAATQVEHARPFDSTIANQRHIGSATANVHENAALRPGFFARAGPRERIRLRDGGGQLEIELAHDGLDRVDVSHRGESLEQRHLEVLACEPDRVRDRVAADAPVREGGW